LDKGEDAELLIGNKKNWNKNARVLVAGFKKGGVGLNDPSLTMAIIASDTSDVRQYEGRIRTTDNIIYHVVHNHKSFERHWEPCETWYINKGADVKIIDMNYILLLKILFLGVTVRTSRKCIRCNTYSQGNKTYNNETCCQFCLKDVKQDCVNDAKLYFDIDPLFLFFLKDIFQKEIFLEEVCMDCVTRVFQTYLQAKIKNM
jgi:hypothetical protein